MTDISKILVFLLVNTLGFCSVALCYYLGQMSGAFSVNDPGFDAASFKHDFLVGTLLTWLACAAFSFSYFFIKSKARLLFLWAPVVVPVAYGLSVL